MAITPSGSAEVSVDGLTGASGAAPGQIDITFGAYAFDFLNAARDDATGSITLSQQAVVTIDGGALGEYGTARGAVNEGSTGTITVQDPGTRLVVEGEGASRIEVSRFGTGFLDILDGGEAEALWMETARNGEGTVSIDGAGSLLLLSGDNGSFRLADGSPDAFGGFARVGNEDGAVGRINVTNGGTLRIENASTDNQGRDGATLRLGQNTDATGELVIEGAGSRAEVVQRGPADVFNAGAKVEVGAAGQGTVLVDAGRLDVLGDNASLQLGSGREGQANTSRTSLIEIRNGGQVRVDSLDFGGSPGSGEPFFRGAEILAGRQPGTDGRIVVEGAGSTLTSTSATNQAGDYDTGQIIVGFRGNGVMDVYSGGYAFANGLRVGMAAVGYDSDGNYQQQNFGFLYDVRAAGTGAVAISGGGEVVVETPSNTPYRGVQIATSSGTYGMVSVDGTGSLLTSRGGAAQIDVGVNGDGRLTITNGAEARGFAAEAGREFGAYGLITVDGAGSRLLLSDAYGAYAGYAEGGFLRAGRNDGSYGRIEVRNGGSIYVINDPMGDFDLPAIHVGRNDGAEGRLEIYGAGSSINVILTGASDDAYTPGYTAGAEVAVGRGGYGSAAILDGGVLNIQGEDSRLFIAGRGENDDVSDTGSGDVVVGSGGTISVSGPGSVTSIASNSGNSGALIVRDAGSSVAAGDLLLVGAGWNEDVEDPANVTAGVTGRGGSARLEIAGGATVSAGLTLVGGGGTLDGDGRLDGDLSVDGGLEVAGPEALGALEVTGDLALNAGARFLFEVAEFDTGEADFLQIGGDAAIDFSGVDFRLDLDDASVSPGDTVILATVGGTLSPGSATVSDGGMPFRLVASGQDLVLEAVDLSGDDLIEGGEGNDDLEGGDGNDTIRGGGADDRIAGNAGDDSLDGGDGLDLLSFADSGPVFIRLGDGAGDDGEGGTDTWENFEGIEGSAFSDDLVGDDGDNTLIGGPGDDNLRGGPGADILDGGEGFDNANYFDSDAGVDIDLDRVTQSGGFAEGDAISSIEGINGSNFDDTIAGGSDFGRFFRGNLGADLIISRSEFDFISGTLEEHDGGRIEGFEPTDRLEILDVTLAGLTLTTTTMGGDTVLTLGDGTQTATLTLAGGFNPFRIDDNRFGGVILRESNPFGTEFDDFLVGGNGDDLLEGFEGFDVLDGGPGADTLDGGADGGLARYREGAGPVTVNLETGEVGGGDAEGDVLISIGSVEGSDFDDVLIGSRFGNFIQGGGGADTMTGGDGRDDFGEGILEFDGDVITDFATEDALLVFGTPVDELDFSTTVSNGETEVTLGDAFGTEVTLTLEGTFDSFTLEDDGSGETTRITARRTPDPEEGILRGTSRDDAILVAQNATYLGAGGADIFLVSRAAVDDGKSVIDGTQESVVQFIEGLEVVSSLVLRTALQLDLSNGARIQVLNANEVTFDTGGNASLGEEGIRTDYETFADAVLGVEVPDDNSVVTGGEAIITPDAFFF